MSDLLAEGGRQLLLGNEAIVRGLFEAGTGFASTYPGTPSSEIGNLLERYCSDAGMYFEFSDNEKIAVEVSAAAASAGVRSFVFMKHVGLNVAADPMMTLAYAGVRAGMLILTADDPSAHSSQNEQDNRFYSHLGLLPLVEPSTPDEARRMVAEAYRISEELELPVIFRTTTRVNHARAPVDFAPRTVPVTKGHFERDFVRFVNVPANAKVNRKRLLEKNRRALEMSEASPLNVIEGEGDVGVITSGAGYNYVKEAVSGVSILKLGFTNPLPERKISDFARGKRCIIVVEELDPFLEDGVLRILAQYHVDVPVYGKRSGHLPYAWEYSPDTLTGIRDLVKVKEFKEPLPKPDVKLPSRPPTLCAGCPHRGSFAATKRAVGKRDVIYCSDIGCYTLGGSPPFNEADFIICMGGGAGAAGGFSQVTDQLPIAFMGDSTFFHSGINPLINALFNGHKLVMVVLDNSTTAMTGHQPNPGTGRCFGGVETEPLSIESIAKGVGAKFVRTMDPYDIKAATQVMKEAIEFDGVAVVIARQPCPLELKKMKKLVPRMCTVDQSKCTSCYTCLRTVACPALVLKDGAVQTDPTQCIGCFMCGSVCPVHAIEVRQ